MRKTYFLQLKFSFQVINEERFGRALTGYFSLLGDACKDLYAIDKAMTKLNLME